LRRIIHGRLGQIGITSVSPLRRVGSTLARPRLSRAAWINGGLAVLLIGLATWGYLSVGDPGRTQTVSSRNATVTRGTLTASVSGSGNTESAAQVGVNFTNSGTLTAVDVTVGHHVRTGQILATIDPGSARQDLAAAEAQLATAQASYDQTAAGQSPIDRTRDQIAVASARLRHE
jgi:multidrug efflux pump subunit AcrA (membrane-fusion protein)